MYTKEQVSTAARILNSQIMVAENNIEQPLCRDLVLSVLRALVSDFVMLFLVESLNFDRAKFLAEVYAYRMTRS
jgi:hypothetical protein